MKKTNMFVLTMTIVMGLMTSTDANAKPRDCTADFTLTAQNGNSKYIANVDFGDVRGIFGAKQRKCLDLATAHCKKFNNDADLTKWLAETYKIGLKDACKKGGTILIDTTVEGKKKSKDGSCNFKPSC